MADMVGMILAFLGQLLFEWLRILVAPLTSFDMIWIIIPIYLNWLVTEYTQEKKSTSLGNAITNGVVALWVGLDWLKTTLNATQISTTTDIVKYGVSIFMIIYGCIIIFEGVRLKKITQLIGRIREISYFSLMLTPVVYGVVDVSWISAAAIALFLIPFYLFFEVVFRLLPIPKELDEGGGAEEFNAPMENPSLGAEPSMNSKDELSFPKEESAIDTMQKKQAVQPRQQPVQQPAVQQTSYPCPTCGGTLVYVPQYSRYYCPSCRRYV